MAEERVRVEVGILQLVETKQDPLVLLVLFGDIDENCPGHDGVCPGDTEDWIEIPVVILVRMLLPVPRLLLKSDG